MCSRYLNKPTGLTEKQKPLKPKNTERKHPASFSQSWTGAPTRTRNFHNKRTTKPEPTTQRHSRKSVQQRTFHGPNPSLPHLKYGLFKKAKNPSAISSAKPHKMPHEKTQKGEESEPVYVTRPDRNTRCLTRAASTHLDIKPRPIK